MDKERLQEHMDAFNQLTYKLHKEDSLRVIIKKKSGQTYSMDIEEGDLMISVTLTKREVIKIQYHE